MYKLDNILILKNTSIKNTMKAIDKGIMRIAFIVDKKNKLLGCVTDGDIRRALMKGVTLEEPIAKIMNKNPVVAKCGTSEQELFKIMNNYFIEQIPLVDDEKIIKDVALFSQILKKHKLIPLSEPYLGGTELKYVTECIRSNTISTVGRFLDLFEKKFAKFLGVKYAVSTCNGTAAIHTALRVLNVKPDDEVIVPTLTFVATVNPIIYLGAKPVFVDSEKETWNIDPEKIEEKITPKTKVIIPVHLYGHPANMYRITEVARKHNLKIIEDATEALGSKYYNRNVGTIGDIGCFSFNGNKIITTGGGGMIVSNNKEYINKAKYLINQARDDSIEYIHKVVGYNYRLPNIQAAIGVAQIEKIQEHIKSKRLIAKLYSEKLSKINGITTGGECKWAFNCFWMYSILIDKKTYGLSKNELLKILNKKGIQVRPFFKPLHTLLPYKKFNSSNIKVANYLYENGLNLPCSVGLKEEEIELICNTIAKLGNKK